MTMENSSEKKSFKDTLNLPRTDFPIRANPKIEDPKILEKWEHEDLYKKSFEHNSGEQKYILHDGPPYANGNIHLGHAYNKILKDIVTKVQRMLGKHVPVTPGWDCHGLPIELKVTQENPGLPAQDLKKACREYANKWINIQRKEFKKLGVLMDWQNPYLTMNFSYEASILRAFGQFVSDGYIERKNKTVPWCASCQTVLAIAEIEYIERKDPSIYVLFPFDSKVSGKLFPELNGEQVNLLIWTTTPWTLPLNRAVLLKPDAEYVLLKINGKNIIVARDLADNICTLLGVKKEIIAQIHADKFVGLKVGHPFISNLQVPILLEPSVSLQDGTAVVHCAPGCGPEDYDVGIRNNLEIFSPISASGKYVVGIDPKELEGMPVADGQIWVIKKLAELDRLFFKTSIKHSYPHCWRCRNGLIFRATTQWFLDLSKNNLRLSVLDAIDGIKMLPDKSNNRLKASIEGRLEWCISRQRIWGVPIPALTCIKCETTFTNKNLIDKVASNVENEGIEFWDSVDPKTLLNGQICSNCSSNDFKKETDILDVWFDSGVSHYAVLKQNKNLAFPADMYLEGKDQHRGWFQSSLLTSLALNKKACMKIIVTHGFTVDESGKKMSKSLGNVVSPDQMADQLGTDGLRMWASSIDIEGEAVVSPILLRNIQEVFRKVRNTCRFLISNLYDFDIAKDAVPVEKMLPIDRLALEQLCQVNQNIINNYENYEFTNVFHKFGDYCSVELSSFYLDIIKDRLYVEQSDGLARRSAQTACWYILDTMTKLMAPILSFTSEQISDYYQKNKSKSIHLQNFANLDNLCISLNKFNQDFKVDRKKQIEILKDVRSAFLKAIEEQREKGLIKHPLEVRMEVFFDPRSSDIQYLTKFFKEVESSGQDIPSFFKDFLIVSQFEIVETAAGLKQTEYPGIYTKVEKALGEKCPRCWQWGFTQNVDKLCKRCEKIVS